MIDENSEARVAVHMHAASTSESRWLEISAGCHAMCCVVVLHNGPVRREIQESAVQGRDPWCGAEERREPRVLAMRCFASRRRFPSRPRLGTVVPSNGLVAP